ncbi:MAG: radical SAM family heme chaperone HemW [Gemmatimonadaceae bacterium]
MRYRHVYVHVPFCARRCSYCDFSIAVRRDVPAAAFADSIAREVRIRELEQPTVALDTLYLGGGTPSRLGAEGVARLMGVLLEGFPIAPGAETTIEANPEDVNAAAVRAWRAAGINRVSLGVQSFDPGVLQWMHRVHSVEDAVRAVEVIREQGIEAISLDLIYALPAVVTRDWERDLEQAIALGPPHLSCYGLTIEPRTPLARWESRGEVAAAGEDSYEREFLAAHQRLTACGFQHYEVSNYALPDSRAVHNSAYWNAMPYLGLGPSAHGFEGTRRRWNVRELVAWESCLAAGRDPVEGSEELRPDQRMIEEVYLGLRTDRGVPWSERDEPLVGRWCEAGWAVVADRRLHLSPTGWLRLDALAAALTEHRSRY